MNESARDDTRSVFCCTTKNRMNRWKTMALVLLLAVLSLLLLITWRIASKRYIDVVTGKRNSIVSRINPEERNLQDSSSSVGGISNNVNDDDKQVLLNLDGSLKPSSSSSVSGISTGNSRLMIHIPRNLSKPNGYPHQVALFGMPSYGGRLIQTVYYAEADLCHVDVNTTHRGYPTRPVDAATGIMSPWLAPFILVVNRGQCTFVQKVRNAQHVGASGVLIADSYCYCGDKECMRQVRPDTCQSIKTIMVDDGSGWDVSIPSFLLRKNDADVMIGELKANRPVQVEMAWNLPTLPGNSSSSNNSDNVDIVVDYSIWTSPSDTMLAMPFLQSFAIVAAALTEQRVARFTPHMYIIDGTRFNCFGTPSSDQTSVCANLCTNNGRYCAIDVDDVNSNSDVNGNATVITGAKVVQESLRRICIWTKYGVTTTTSMTTNNGGLGGLEWWLYVNAFCKHCAASATLFNDSACIQKAYQTAGINRDQIDSCMADSGGLDDDRPNAKLELELGAQQQQGVTVMPVALVNDMPIHEALTVTNVLAAICATYTASAAARVTTAIPKVCECAGCSDPVTCVMTHGSCLNNGSMNPGADNGENSMASIYVISILVVLAACTSAIGWAAWRRRHHQQQEQQGNNEMSQFVWGHDRTSRLAEYLPLESNTDNENGDNDGVIIHDGSLVDGVSAVPPPPLPPPPTNSGEDGANATSLD